MLIHNTAFPPKKKEMTANVIHNTTFPRKKGKKKLLNEINKPKEKFVPSPHYSFLLETQFFSQVQLFYWFPYSSRES